ncbi:MAG: YdeI/OmpD-associated family protein [Thermoleophilia bacterium]
MPAFTAEILDMQRALAVEVPADVLEALGGKRVPVTVALNGATFTTTTGSMGGRVLIGINKATRALTGVAPGEVHEVVVERVAAPRTVDPPAEIADAIAAEPALGATWAGLAPSHQKEYAEWVTSAKRADTRARRAERAVERLREGAKSPR